MNKIRFLVSSTNKVHISTEDDWTWCAYHLRNYKRLDTFESAPKVTVCKFCFDWFGHFAEFAGSLTKHAPDGGTHSAKSGSSKRKKSTVKAAGSQPPQVM